MTVIEPLTGETKWKFPLYSSPWAGTLTTAGNLVFAGDEDGYLIALQADTGRLLWKVNAGTRLMSLPITYQLNGKVSDHASGRGGPNVCVALSTRP